MNEREVSSLYICDPSHFPRILQNEVLLYFILQNSTSMCLPLILSLTFYTKIFLFHIFCCSGVWICRSTCVIHNWAAIKNVLPYWSSYIFYLFYPNTSLLQKKLSNTQKSFLFICFIFAFRICDAATIHCLLEQELAHAVNACSHALNKANPRCPEVRI